MSIGPSVPVPTLVFPCGTSVYKRRNQRDTSTAMTLVRLLDLTFLRRTRGNTGRNVKSGALVANPITGYAPMRAGEPPGARGPDLRGSRSALPDAPPPARSVGEGT